jgi:hypothetical protein
VTLYPSIDEVLAAHARLIALFGGTQGVRDRGARVWFGSGPGEGSACANLVRRGLSWGVGRAGVGSPVGSEAARRNAGFRYPALSWEILREMSYVTE